MFRLGGDQNRRLPNEGQSIFGRGLSLGSCGLGFSGPSFSHRPQAGGYIGRLQRFGICQMSL